MSKRLIFLGLAHLVLSAVEISAQGSSTVARLEADRERVVIEAGTSVTFAIRALDADGGVVNVAIRGNAPWQALRWRNGTLQAFKAGEYELVAVPIVQAAAGDAIPELRIPVTVTWPAVADLAIEVPDTPLVVGTTIRAVARARHADGAHRPDAAFIWTSSERSLATVARDGSITAHAAGTVRVSVSLDGRTESVEIEIEEFPATTLEIVGGLETARTGDVLDFDARASGPDGTDAAIPVTWAYTFVPDDSIAAPGAAGIMSQDGRFVGEVPGTFTILALAGPLSARKLVEVLPREAVRRVELVGQGAVRQVHTSDLWVFEGLDGRDYAITGTWSASGWAYIWDVTDPANVVKTDSLQVDARTVNDVKVSPDGRYAALSREGASNRRNGVVILDLSTPAHPTVASVYDDGLTGGVHNMFATDDHLFALSGGDKYVILDMRDITAPRYVSEYNHPNSRIHDVWVSKGLAYSSEWANGVVVVDVGDGRWGGSIDDPQLVTNVPYPVGRTHAAFPYFQKSTGKTYLFLGDEILTRTDAAFEGFGGNRPFDPATGRGGVQSPSSGYVHVIDFTDPENPHDVARYEIPEAGTHNIWVEDDILYQAYYEGGLRVVDVSGELMGNLATQGREIAVFKPFDPQGLLPNQPNVWGPQPFKGHIFFSDFSSGLWSVKLQPKGRPVS